MIDKIPSKVLVYWKYRDKTGVFEDKQPFVWWNEHDNNWDTFWWDEGNGGCDCNRALSFWGDKDFPCGDTIEIENIEITD